MDTDGEPQRRDIARTSPQYSATTHNAILLTATMEADENEHDSTFGGDRQSVASSSQSLESAVTNYPYEFGRRYHAYQAGAYQFPNDEQELNRMDVEHHNQRLQLDGKLHLAPLENPKEILDLGCGTGIWCIDMADEYPAAQVIGTDLSPVQPTWVPPNCRFEVDDFEVEWTFGESRFDFIHERFLMGSVSSHADFYKNVFAALKPGGWFELVEMECLTFSDDGTVPDDGASNQWGRLLNEAFAKIGKPMLPVTEYGTLLKETGFVNLRSQIMKRPTNDWPKDPKMKEIGRWSCLNFLEGLDGFTMVPLTKALGWAPEEVQVLCAKVRNEMLQRKIHGWQKGIVCYGQKPLDAS